MTEVQLNQSPATTFFDSYSKALDKVEKQDKKSGGSGGSGKNREVNKFKNWANDIRDLSTSNREITNIFANAVASDNPTYMIMLESALQARNQMIEAVSNLFRSLDESARAVIRNIR